MHETIAQAAQELTRLHEEFPEVTIPDETRLLAILYEKQPNVKSPVQKYKFEVQALPEGGFLIAYKRNTRGLKAPSSATREAGTSANAQNPQGYFTAMVKLKRRRKPASGSNPVAST